MFPRSAGVGPEQAKLLPADGAEGDEFGLWVAVDGDTAVVGARLDDDNGETSGSAYAFTRSADVWTQQAKLLPSDPAAFDGFGMNVVVDGDTAVVNEWVDESAYVFTRTGGVWTEQAKLVPSDSAAGDFFGWSLSLDGDVVLIGAYLDDDNGDSSGSAYIFMRTRGAWTEQLKLLADDGDSRDQFGVAVGLDGDTAVIGADHDDDNGNDSGSAYVFRLYDDDMVGSTEPRDPAQV